MSEPDTVTSVDREPAFSDLARRMLAGYFDELATRFPGGLEPDPAHAAQPSELSPPGGAFFVIRVGGAPVGCGGLRRLDDQTAEIKHMWIDPAARGRGLSRGLLAALESEAAALGYARIRLDTSRHLHEAAALYRSCGYRSIPAYNENPYAAHWFEKHLAPEGAPAVESGGSSAQPLQKPVPVPVPPPQPLPEPLPVPQPLPEGILDDHQRRLLSALVLGPRAGLFAAERSPTGWALPGPFGPMLLSPLVGDPLQELGASIRYRGSLDAAARELAIVATAFACGCRYELDHHLPLARAAGVSEVAIAAAAAGGAAAPAEAAGGAAASAGAAAASAAAAEAPAGQPEPRDAAIVRACGQLAGRGRLDHGLMARLEAELGRAGAFELIVLAGYYRLLAGILSAYGVG